MYFFEAANQNYQLPSTSVFDQNIQPPSPTLPFYTINEAQIPTINAPLTRQQQQPQPQPHMFAVPQHPSVISAPVSSPALMWAANNMYGAAQMVAAPDDAAARFLPPKCNSGAAVQTMQPVLVPQQQTPGGPLLYMVATVPMQQSFQQAAPPEKRSRHLLSPISQMMMQENSAAMTPQTIPADEVNPKNTTLGSPAADLQGSGKNAKINVNAVCRHFMKSCCNRRKCRFLHTPDDASLPNI
ncbi:hypothetical protein DQ04_05351000 [Trypanosoma grayi]|uniref:hypothetical protein n=1 Tax=Trypanosoma grayi TaxID=71804 RepID=UPI0004F441F5|nr:hypothetical protein DQ04_05351000 [Trypanosoma grayi]KEG09359.1 hypothetical protein DQ04_05351000 [Trypanosoma grayi]